MALLVFGSIFVVVLNEWIVYYANSWKWNTLDCNSKDCTRILLVADPQIIGETFDTNVYNGLAMQDSDRFLRYNTKCLSTDSTIKMFSFCYPLNRKTFRRVLSHTSPDVIVFLGDLMDEGSVANKEQFERYVNRFKDVFYVPNNAIVVSLENITRLSNLTLQNVQITLFASLFAVEQKMHISGDNDIGGETTDDSVTADKVKRFKEAFDERGYVDVRNRLRVFNINQFSHYYPNVTKNETPSMYHRVVVTHMSLLSYTGASTEKVNF